MTDTLKYIDVNPDEAKRMAQRMHVKKDDIQFVRKGYEVKIEDQNDDDRTITARVSTADRDRDDEIVEPKGIDLKDYQKNPVLGWAHKYDHPAVGKALWSKTDANGLICKFQFAETQFADDLYQLYKGGFMKAFSIGFIPMEYDQKTKTHQKISLMEVSCVLVPANQNALVMEAYQKGLIKSESLKKDLEIEEDEGKRITEEILNNPIEMQEIADGLKELERGEIVPRHVPEPVPEVMERVSGSDPVSEAPVDAGQVTLKLDADISGFETKVDALQVKLEAMYEIWEKMNGPAPLAEVRADPPIPIDEIEIDPPVDILSSIEPGKLAPSKDFSLFFDAGSPNSPTLSQLSAPKVQEMTPEQIQESIIKAIENLDIRQKVKDAVALNLDRMRGRVR